MPVQTVAPSRPVHVPIQKMSVGFDWSFRSDSGTVHAVSFAQAVERAKVAWLRQHNIGPQTPSFRQEMLLLKDAPIKLKLDYTSFSHFIRLYKAFQQGEIDQQGRADLKQFQSIIQAKEVHNAHHFRTAKASA